MPGIVSKIQHLLTPDVPAGVVGAAPIASDLDGNAEWSPSAAALLPDVLPVAGTLLSYGGSRQLQSGGTVTHGGHFLFSPNNQYDIGDGTYNPRTVRAATSVLSPRVLVTAPDGASSTPLIVSVPDQNPYAAQFLGRNTNKSLYIWMDNSGHGNLITDNAFIVQTGGYGNTRLTISAAGAATFSGDINMQRTSSQGSIRAYSPNGSYNCRFYVDNSAYTYLLSNSGSLALIPHDGNLEVTNNSSVDAKISVYNAAVNKYIRLTHDGTNGIVSTSSGALELKPSSGTVVAYDTTQGYFTQLQHTEIVSQGNGDYAVSNGKSGGALNFKTNAGSGRTTRVSIASTGTMTCSYPLIVNANQEWQNGSGSTYAGWVASSRVFYAGGDVFAVLTSDGTTRLYEGGKLCWNDTAQASSGTVSAQIRRPSTGLIHFEANNGIAVRNLANSADAPISCAGITASGAIQETYRTSSLDPTTSDIGSGKAQRWWNSTASEFRDWVNVSGSLYKSAAYSAA